MAVSVALLMPLGATASAAGQGEQFVRETYVLPVGAAVPTLEELSTVQGREAVMRWSQSTERAVTALETVGPAAGYGKRADDSSATPGKRQPRALAGASAAAAAVSYPDPARQMTVAECKAKIDNPGGGKFYVKSRFSVCTGIKMLSYWSRNNRPVGTSELKVFVRGSVPKENDRTMRFDYDVVEMKKIGQIPTNLEQYTLEGSIPQVWPKAAKAQQGGNLPVRKSFDALKAMPSAHFTQTVRYAPGQGTGSGAADVIFAVYQPVVTSSAVPGWIGTPNVGKPFMLAPRWDAARYLSNPTGGTNPANKGSASFSYLATLTYSAKTGAPERGVALHIQKAFTSPKATKPPNGDKKVAGQSASDPLHRLYLDEKRRKDNRARAVTNCRSHFGANYTDGGKECDEYPFATTYEGCAQSEYDPRAPKKNFSVMPVPAAQNGDAGTLLGQFYKKNRVIDGMDDGFTVKITT
ncbi:NucA/NucB deoxyribonuclease domain-containing protein [Streptomyces sp. NPDC013953]|uniref:NucA/NucB deoxyribonuclease domain-containing protein n=1 Tax=Streptomyces sp. NPDC013953 TaxID=3364868 RepID=UPI0036FB0EAA